MAVKAARNGKIVRARGAAGKLRPFAKRRPTHSSATTYARALRFLNTLADYERQRIVRYTSQNFDLDRMRTLLRKLSLGLGALVLELG